MEERPNILIIMSDQHSPHVIGCAGDGKVRTPFIDKLAGEGVFFSRAYCAGPLCVPSRMSFLTGKSCSDIGVVTNGGVLPHNSPTFLHMLGIAGYETVLCGRMHFSPENPKHGFEKKIVGDVSTRWSSKSSGYLFGKIPPGLNGSDRVSIEISGRGRTAYQAFDRDVTESAVDFLSSRKKSDRPFCLVAGLVLPHNPYICPPELFDEYFPHVDIPRMTCREKDGLHSAVRKWRKSRGLGNLSDSQIAAARAAYYGLVTMTDSFVGEITAALEENGLSEKTMVLYLSDHGEMAGEHEMWWKSNFYEASVGVPLIISFPGVFRSGGLCAHPVSLLDIAPTIMEMAGGENVPGASGNSLIDCLNGSCKGRQEKDVFSEIYETEIETPVRMIVRWPWKLVYYHGFKYPQLFNLEKDPGETVDFGKNEAFREELMEAVLKNWSGDLVNMIRKEEKEKLEILLRWTKSVKAPDADCWNPPPGANEFPSH